MSCKFIHDPDAVLSYAVDIRPWLDGDTILSRTEFITPDQTGEPTPFEIFNVSHTSEGLIGYFVRNGERTKRYVVTFRISTFAGLTRDFSVTFICQNR